MLTDPRNFYTTKGKSGQTKDNVYFMKTSFIACDDPFKQAAANSLRKFDPAAMQKAGHDKEFRPAKRVRERLYTMSYDHGINPPLPKKVYRNAEENNAVTIGPRNFLTSPMKEGVVGTAKATSFGGIVLHGDEDYDRQKKLAAAERATHASQIAQIHDAKNFS